MRLKVSPKEHHTFKRLRGFKYVEKFIDGTFLACGFLEKKKDIGASNGSRRKASLVNQEKNLVLVGA
jgi:hypothetical protein